MHKRGHRGITFLVLAPILYVLLPDRPVLALLSLGILVTERLPDKDQGISWIEHRKTSHSFLSAAVVGVICAAIGWVLGRFITPPVAGWLSSAASSGDSTISTLGSRMAFLDAPTFAAIGFAIGAGGMVVHYLGDIITRGGLQPFLPVSHRKYALTRMYAKNRIANTGFFVLGVLALLVSLASVSGVL